MLWDGECGFCRRWAQRFERWSSPAVAYLPYQKALTRFPEIPAAELARTIHLIERDGQIYRGAHAVFRALRRRKVAGWLLSAYVHVGPFAWLSELAYRFVARNRGWLSRVTR